MSKATRFQAGTSGNPSGRPRKAQGAETTTAFDVVFDQTITVREGAGTRELSAEEALQLRTYQEAVKGSRIAQRTIMKMIAKREAWRAKHEPRPHRKIEVKHEQCDRSRNALAAMLALGIATPYENDRASKDFLLEPWAVETALRRRKKRTLDRLERGNIRVSVRDWTSLNLDQYPDDNTL